MIAVILWLAEKILPTVAVDVLRAIFRQPKKADDFVEIRKANDAAKRIKEVPADDEPGRLPPVP